MAKSDVLVRWKADTQNYDANMAKAKSTLNGFVQSNLTAGGVMKQLASTMVATAGSVAGVTAAVHAITGAIKSNIQTAMGFEKSMSQLSSLTGMVGKDLEQLKEYAIELGSTTTLSASQVADAFKMIGSQQPQLLQSGKALKQVTEYAIRLSEAAGIELSTAAQTLSTSINQMGGDSNNAERYINVLAAASQKGAGDIAWLGEAITKSAAIAKAAGTDYEELVANLEQLAKAGFDASTSGTALRSIIMNLEKQANQEFKPSVVGLTQAFENLGKANLDIAGYQGIVGKMFAAQAMALANAAGEARKMTKDITGTNTAMSQAKTNVDNLDGSLKSLSSAWEGFNLHLNSSNGFLRDVVDGLTNTVRLTDQLFQSISNLTGPLGTLFTMIGNLVKYPLESLNKKLAIATGLFNTLKGYIGGGNGGSSHSSEVGLYKNNPVLDSIMGNSSQYGSPIPEYVKPTPTSHTSDNGIASLSELKAQLKELRKLRDEAIEEGDMALRDDYNAQIKAIQQQIKVLKGDGTTTKKTIAPDGSIAAQEKLVEDLTKKWKEATDQVSREGYLKQLEEAQKTLAQMTSGDGSIAAQEKLVEDLTKKWKEATDQVGREGYLKQLEEAKKTLEEMVNENDIEKLYPQRDVSDQQSGGRSPFETYQQRIRQEVASKNMEVDEKTMHTLMQTAIQNGIDSVDADFSSVWQQMAEGMDIPDSTWTELQNKLNSGLKDFDLDPIEVDLDTGDLKKKKKDVKDVTDAFQAAAISAEGLATALRNFDDPTMRIVSIIAEAIANVASGAGAAIAKAGQESASWIDYLAASTSVTAQMITTIAEIRSATKYAQGGFVKGGGHFSGDDVLIMANEGELVLTRAQQGILASQLSEAGGGGGGADLRPYVDAEKVYLGFENMLTRRGKGEIVTTSMLRKLNLI